MRSIRAAVLEESGAARPYGASQPLRVQQVQLNDPGPAEVLVRIEAAGLCHSDLSVVDGNRPRPLPMVLGHESAGIVEQLGDRVQGLRVGQRVVSSFLPRCGTCPACATNGKLPCTPGSAANTAGTLLGGQRRLMRGGRALNHHLGVSGFATHAVMDARSLVPVGDDVPAQVAAVLGCAVLTGGGAIRNAARATAGDSILVVGLGGVGMAALLVALATVRDPGPSVGKDPGSTRTGAGAHTPHGKVIAVDMNPQKLRTAQRLGADVALTPQQLAQQGLSAAVVIEAAGHPRAFETAFSATAVGGTLVTVGLPAPGAMSQIEPLALTAGARTIIGSYLGSAVPATDIPFYERLWREGRLPVEELVSGTCTLDEINDGLEELAAGRAVRTLVTF